VRSAGLSSHCLCPHGFAFWMACGDVRVIAALAAADTETIPAGGVATVNNDVFCTSSAAVCAAILSYPGTMQSHLQALLPLSYDDTGVVVRFPPCIR
jgi:hypothetical protein